MSVNATTTIPRRPTPKRTIWREAHGSKSPPAALYNMAKPMDAVRLIKIMNGQ